MAPEARIGWEPHLRLSAGCLAVDVDDAGLDISYEVDLFGRIGRNVEASRGDVAAAEATFARAQQKKFTPAAEAAVTRDRVADSAEFTAVVLALE